MWDKFEEAFRTDDESPEKKEKRIIATYETANEKEKALINDLFITICGYSLETLIND